MEDVLEGTLYKKQFRRFEQISDFSKNFAGVYCGTTIIRDSIFEIVLNYARKKELSLEVLRYPFKDDELWAFTFVKKGTLFLCVNSDLAICKQLFAVAHELYHIHCYTENIEQNVITGGSLLDSKTADELAATQEDLEANAFAGLLLMPDIRMQEQAALFGISGENIKVDDILILMDLFALPYKAVVLRLVEGKVIKEEKARELLNKGADFVAQRIKLTGKAQQWQINSSGYIYLGSLLDNLEYNSENDLLTDSRSSSDKAYIEKIKKGFCREG